MVSVFLQTGYVLKAHFPKASVQPSCTENRLSSRRAPEGAGAPIKPLWKVEMTSPGSQMNLEPLGGAMQMLKNALPVHPILTMSIRGFPAIWGKACPPN